MQYVVVFGSCVNPSATLNGRLTINLFSLLTDCKVYRAYSTCVMEIFRIYQKNMVMRVNDYVLLRSSVKAAIILHNSWRK